MQKLFCQIKKFPIQDLEFDRSDFMTAILYSSSIPAVPTNEKKIIFDFNS